MAGTQRTVEIILISHGIALKFSGFVLHLENGDHIHGLRGGDEAEMLPEHSPLRSGVGHSPPETPPPGSLPELTPPPPGVSVENM